MYYLNLPTSDHQWLLICVFSTLPIGQTRPVIVRFHDFGSVPLAIIMDSYSILIAVL